MNIKILTSANTDLIDGYHFYENQKDGLGTYFLDSLYSDIDSLTIYAGIHPVFFKKYYRLLSKRFPFAIYYRVKEDMVYIYAILDSRRNPKYIETKLKK